MAPYFTLEMYPHFVIHTETGYCILNISSRQIHRLNVDCAVGKILGTLDGKGTILTMSFATGQLVVQTIL